MNRTTKVGFFIAISLFAFPTDPAHAPFINFDNLSAGVKPGNVYANLGVTFSTCQFPKNVKLGSLLTPALSRCTDGFQVLANNDAISLPNFAVAKGLGIRDVLMTFSKPVTYVELFSDKNPTEAADKIRLLALQRVSNGLPAGVQYKVVKIYESLDDRTGIAMNNLLAVGLPQPFSAAVFQTTTEAEGFDNLTFIFSTPPERDCDEGQFDLKCLEEFVVGPQWIPVGCETIDCCPCCPGNCLDWIIHVEGDPIFSVVLYFDNLAPEVARGLKTEGSAKWLDDQRLEIRGKGVTTIRGLRADPNAMLPAMVSPRMSLERVTAVAPDRRLLTTTNRKVQRSGTVEISVEQMVDGRVVDKTQRVYRFSR
jgi:hypothetical protein